MLPHHHIVLIEDIYIGNNRFLIHLLQSGHLQLKVQCVKLVERLHHECLIGFNQGHSLAEGAKVLGYEGLYPRLATPGGLNYYSEIGPY